MKKGMKTCGIMWVLVLIACMVQAVPAFADDISDNGTIQFLESSQSLLSGDTVTLYLTTESDDAVSWESSDPSIVKMGYRTNTRSAEIFGQSEGIAYVDAIDAKGNRARCIVKVSHRPIKLWKNDVTINLGSSVEISYEYGGTSAITWTSSNRDVVSIGKRGSGSKETYLITGAGLGKAVVTGEDQYGSKTTLNVTVVASYLELEQYSVELRDPSPLSVNIGVIAGEVASVKSSDQNVATAKYDSKKKCITIEAGMKPGTTVITVIEKGGDTKTITVSFSADALKLNKDHIDISVKYKNYYQNNEDDEYSYEGGLVPSAGIGTLYWEIEGISAYSVFKDCIRAVSSSIVSVENLNPEIVTIDSYGGIHPIGVGTATIRCSDWYGNQASFTVTVPKQFIVDYIKKNTECSTISFGDSSVDVWTVPGSTVKAVVSGKTYKGVLKSSYYNKYRVSIPRLKVGAKVKIVIEKGEAKVTETEKVINEVASGNEILVSPNYVYRNSKTVKVVARKVKKGDTIRIKVGKKTFKKRIKKDAKKVICKVRVAQQKPYGKKFTIKLVDKKGITMATTKDYIWYGDKIHKGMTKNQCKWLTSWGTPDDRSVYGSTSIWWYDNGKSITFRHGRVTGWHR